LVSELHVTGPDPAGPAGPAAATLVAVAVVAGDGDPLMPCGRCRQLLLEAGGPSMLVDSGEGPVLLGTLLPGAFDAREMADRSERES
ncbi:MAG TPA: hypothetical protein VMU95_02980, partial [Trebonia sp.]|nr:hypothetical protein [Trebonia sp.]